MRSAKEQKEISKKLRTANRFLAIYRYLEPGFASSNAEFEARILKFKDLSDKEKKDIIRHFKKQIYPLTKAQIHWLYHNKGYDNECRYADIAKEIKALNF